MKKLWPLVAIVVVLIVVAISSLFVVREGQTAIVLQFGRIVRADDAPGLHFKTPLLQQVEFFDSRIQSLDAPAERYFTKEKKSVDVDFYVKWRIADNVTYYRSTTGNLTQARLRLAPIIKDALRFQINSRSLDDLISGGRSEIIKNVISQANQDTIDDLGIKVVDVRIKQIELPKTVSESIYQRMRAERKQLANQLRSTGKEAGETIRANADRKSSVLIANAKRDAAKLRGEGDAKASAIYAKGYSQNPAFFKFYRSLRAYKKAFGDNNSILVIDPHTKFMQYFEGKDSH